MWLYCIVENFNIFEMKNEKWKPVIWHYLSLSNALLKTNQWMQQLAKDMHIVTSKTPTLALDSLTHSKIYTYKKLFCTLTSKYGCLILVLFVTLVFYRWFMWEITGGIDLSVAAHWQKEKSHSLSHYALMKYWYDLLVKTRSGITLKNSDTFSVRQSFSFITDK